MRGLRCLILLGIAVFGLARCPVFAQSQQPVQAVAPVSPSSPVQPSSPPSAAPALKQAKPNHSHANDFLIIGTVFNEKALSFPSVRVRIRRSGEQKFHWDTYTNSRGDFAVRVPQGSQYEIVVHAKGFAEQTHTVDASKGDNRERLTFRMEPVAGGKK
jgi:hypothetical protein